MDSSQASRGCDSPIRLSRDFELKWRFGARTAGLIGGMARRFVSRIEVSHGEDVADARSIMALMTMSTDVSRIRGSTSLHDTALAHPEDDTVSIGAGDRVTVSVEGSDAAAAMEALTGLFTSGPRVDHCIVQGCSSRPCLIGYSDDQIGYGCYRGHSWQIPMQDST